MKLVECGGSSTNRSPRHVLNFNSVNIEYQVRCAKKGDWRILREVRLRALADTPNAFGKTLVEEQRVPDAEWIARIMNPDVAHFLANAPKGIPVGLAVGAPYIEEQGTEEAVEIAGLFGMWVAPEVRKLGIGGVLVDAVVEWARAAKYKRIKLDVADSNLAAIRLYESKGFVPTGRTGTLPAPRQDILEHERCLSLE